MAYNAASQIANGGSHSASGSDRFALLLVLADSTPSTVTYGGVGCALVETQSALGGVVSLWQLVAPATGAQTINATGAIVYGILVSSLTGIHQTTPRRDYTWASVTASPWSALVDTVSGDDVVTLVASGGTNLSSAGGGQTARLNTGDGAVGTLTADAATETPTWALTGGSPTAAGWSVALQPSASGPTYTQSLSASVTATTTVGRGTRRAVAAAVTSSAVVSRRVLRAVVASVSASTTVGRRTRRGVAAGVAASATIATIARFGATLSAAVTATTTIGRRTARSLAASVTGSAAVARKTARTLAASVTGTTAVATVAAFQQALSASVSAATTLGRVTRAALAASIVATTALARLTRRAVSASVSAAASLTPQLVVALVPRYVRAVLTFVSQTVSSLTHRSQVDAALTGTSETAGALTHVSQVDATLTHHTDDD